MKALQRMASKATVPQLTVYRGFEGTNIYTWSPFVTKLEARLRFSNLPYRTDCGSISKSPRSKVPYIAISEDDQAEPQLLSDSSLIIEKLIEDGWLDDINANLSPADRVHDMAIQALLEDKQYWYNGYEKWHENYYTMRDNVMASIPYPMRVVIGLLAYRKNMQTFYGQGTGRFSTEEIKSFRHRIWDNIDALLVVSQRKTRSADDPFWVLAGKTPTEADAVLFGFICSTLTVTAAPESQKYIKGLNAVVGYAQRIHNHYFPDYAIWE